jgi:methionine--tRNA ligase beta chain
MKGKVYQIMGESIKKLNNIISRLDNQLGTSSLIPKQPCKPFSTNQIKIDDAPKIKAEEKQTQNGQSTKKENIKPAKTNVVSKNTTVKASLFDDCDLRVGKVVDIKNMEDSNDIYLLKVDLGEQNPRDIGTGLRKYVPQDELKDKFIIVFSNLKPKKIAGFVSNGMILSSYNQDKTAFELVRPSEGIIIKFIIIIRFQTR